jgi:putative ABC transport system ATP-binding protein
MAKEMPTLQVRNLSHAFSEGSGQTTALRDVSLDLFQGQVALLMGPSGSGKSTLLAIVSGLLRPASGQVLALGRDLWRLTDRQREEFRRQHCGFIFQGYNLFPALTARQQLEMVLRWGEGMPHPEARQRADDMLTLLGLGGKGHLRPHQLSGGEKQRVAIGRALVKQPVFCFADEPTGALDWSRGQQVIELLCDVAHGHGATVLVVAHDHRLIDYADQVFHLEDGRLVEPEFPLAPAARTGSSYWRPMLQE